MGFRPLMVSLLHDSRAKPINGGRRPIAGVLGGQRPLAFSQANITHPQSQWPPDGCPQRVLVVGQNQEQDHGAGPTPPRGGARVRWAFFGGPCSAKWL